MDVFFTLSVIRDEHKKLTAIIQSMAYLARDSVDRGVALDDKLLTMILDYIQAFPNRVHHPKEDEYLFRVLRSRRREAGEVLDALEAEHARGSELVGNLRDLLARCRVGGAAAVEAFAAAVAEYADFYEKHMRKEEDVVMPLAERTVTAADWQAVEDALRANDDLLLGAEEFRKLFQLIMRFAPPPVVRLLASVSL